MTAKRLKRPRDPVQLGKLVGDILTGQVEDNAPDSRNAEAVSLGQKGGKARAERMSPERRSEIAKRAAKKRWNAAD